MKLGEMLCSKQIISDTQLQHALEIQDRQNSREKLGEVLIKLGYATEEEVFSILALQNGIPLSKLRYPLVPEIASLAHDLKNPLSVIQGYLHLITDGILGELSRPQTEIIHHMDQACKVMMRLLEDLMDISVIESGHLELDLQETSLSEYLQDCHLTNQILAQMKSIELVLEIDEDLPVVRMDPDRMDQVLNNLISNAIKFSHPNTTTTISARVVDDEVLISVADQGQGIPEEELSKLFTQFGRTSVRPTSGERSVGLGLAIVKRIVEAHGGRIWVESEVGRGTVFTFTILIESPSTVRSDYDTTKNWNEQVTAKGSCK